MCEERSSSGSYAPHCFSTLAIHLCAQLPLLQLVLQCYFEGEGYLMNLVRDPAHKRLLQGAQLDKAGLLALLFTICGLPGREVLPEVEMAIDKIFGLVECLAGPEVHMELRG